MSFIKLSILLFNLLICKSIAQNPVLKILKTKLPNPRYLSTAVYDGNDSIYILGGTFISNDLDSILKFTISTETIESLGSLPEASAAATAIWDGTGVVYFGGYNNKYLNNIIKYTPGEPGTKEIGTLPQPNGYTTTVTVNAAGDAFLFGGGNNPYNIVKWSNNLATVVKDAPLNAVYGASSIHSSESIYVFGGYYKNSPVNIIEFNIVSGKVTTLPQTTYSMSESRAIFNGTYGFIIGGNSDKNPTNVIRFNPLNKEVTPLNVKGFPDHFYGHSTVFVPKLNRVFIFGGYSSAGQFNGYTQIVYLDL